MVVSSYTIIVYTAIEFAMYDGLMHFMQNHDHSHHFSKTQEVLASSFVASIVASLVSNPLEVTQIKMQTNSNTTKNYIASLLDIK